MAEINVHFDFQFSSRTVRLALIGVLVLAAAPELASESVSLTTYYPAPSGVYVKLITTSNTYLARDSGCVDIGTSAGGCSGYVLNVPVVAGGSSGNVNVGGTLNVGEDLTVASGAVAASSAGLSVASSGALVVTGTSSLGGASFDTSGNETTTGNVTAGAFYYTSDARLKTGIHAIPGALEKLLAVNGVSFRWKDSGRPDMGVVAQDVAKAFPDLVKKNDKGFMSVEYANLIGPTIEAIRQLNAKTESLQAQILLLRTENERLRKKIESSPKTSLKSALD